MKNLLNSCKNKALLTLAFAWAAFSSCQKDNQKIIDWDWIYTVEMPDSAGPAFGRAFHHLSDLSVKAKKDNEFYVINLKFYSLKKQGCYNLYHWSHVKYLAAILNQKRSAGGHESLQKLWVNTTMNCDTIAIYEDHILETYDTPALKAYEYSDDMPRDYHEDLSIIYGESGKFVKLVRGKALEEKVIK